MMEGCGVLVDWCYVPGNQLYLDNWLAQVASCGMGPGSMLPRREGDIW
jgi:hypothetical protein